MQAEYWDSKTENLSNDIVQLCAMLVYFNKVSEQCNILQAVFDQMGDNLDGIFIVNVVIMGAIFLGAMVLSIDTMWTRKKDQKSAVL